MFKLLVARQAARTVVSAVFLLAAASLTPVLAQSAGGNAGPGGGAGSGGAGGASAGGGTSSAEAPTSAMVRYNSTNQRPRPGMSAGESACAEFRLKRFPDGTCGKR